MRLCTYATHRDNNGAHYITLKVAEEPPIVCGETRLFGKAWICEFSQCNVRLFICINLVGLLLGKCRGRETLFYEAFSLRYMSDFASTMYSYIYT